MLRFKYLADMLKKRKEAEAKKEDDEAAEGADADVEASTVNSAASERCSTPADS